MIKVSRGCLGAEELEAVKGAFDYGYFGMAGKVVEFEKALEDYLGGGTVVATNTGTSALHLALDALEIGPGDEVIVPSLTFVASFQAVSATGANPVSCEVRPETLLLDLEDVRRRITPRTKAVMPVHYAGNPCDMSGLLQLKKERGIRIVEDAAHAFGTAIEGKMIGSFGDITCFSFDSIKNITCGEGGAVVCRDTDLVEILRRKRLLGMDRKAQAASNWKDRTWKFSVGTQGFRYHMSNINAAIGLAQIKKLDGFIKLRREICLRYNEAFREIRVVEPLEINYETIAPHIYVVRVGGGKRDALAEYLKNREIETGVHYIPNHLHPMYCVKGQSLPVTESVFDEILTLPLHCDLSNDDVARVIEAVREFSNKNIGGSRK